LLIDLLPAYRVFGGMGQTHLLEGFDRGEVAQVMRWHSVADERDAWDVIAYCERAIAGARHQQRQSADDNNQAKTPDQIAAVFGF
jgi:hypothetical protein